MSYTRWGVDSCIPVTSSLASSVKSFSNGNVSFWARYFSPVGSSGCTAMDAEGGSITAEINAMKGIGVRYVVPLCSPGSGRLGTIGSQGTTYGQADGAAVCRAINAACANSGYKMVLPGNGQLRVYLDAESGKPFSTAYWQAWGTAVAGALDYNGYPTFDPCCYCNPGDGIACNTLTANGGAYDPYAVWSSEPEQYGGSYCSVPGPGWTPPTAPLKCSGIYTVIWQYAESGQNCSNFSNFDLDESTPGEDEAAYMLYLP